MARYPQLPGTAEQKHFPGTNAPVLLLAPDRSKFPVYSQRGPNVAFFPPPGYFAPGPGAAPSPSPGPPGPGPSPEPPEPPDPEPGDEAISVSFESDSRECALCGFSELASPSVPPKKYHNRSILGPLAKYSYVSFTGCSLTNPPEGSISFTGPIPDSPYVYHCDISCFIIAETELTVTYQIVGAGSPVPPDPSHGDFRLVVSHIGPVNSGHIFTVSKGSTFAFAGEWNYIYWHGAPGSTMTLTAAPVPFEDTWAIQESYGLTDCVFEQILVAYRTYASSVLQLIDIPEISAFVAAGQPQNCYPPYISPVTGPNEPIYVATDPPTPTHRETYGLGCVDNPFGFGPRSINATGTINEDLSVEDTEAMAIARASPMLGVSNVAYYEPRTAGFEFLWQKTTAQLQCTGLVVGHDYKVQLAVTTEDYGGGSPVASVVDLYFTATAATRDFTHEFIAARGDQITVGIATIEEATVLPVLVSAEIDENGTTWRFTFSEAVVFGGSGSSGWAPVASGGAVSLTYASGTGTNVLLYNGNRVIDFGETATIGYSQPGNGIQDATGNLLATFAGASVDNNSGDAEPPSVMLAAVLPSGTDVEVLFDHPVTIGAGGAGGMVAIASGLSVALTYASGAGTDTLVFTAARTIYDYETVTLDYTQPGHGIERTGTTEDLATFTGQAVNNESVEALDAETIAWRDYAISQGGTFEADSVVIANALIVAIKAASFNTKIKGLWPLLGANLTTARIPLRDSLSAGIATNFGFANADFDQATGLQGNGLSKMLILNITPSQLGTAENGGLGYWENNINFGGTSLAYPFGTTNTAGTNYFSLYTYVDSDGGFYWGLPANIALSGGAGTNGHYYGQRSSATSRVIYKNAVSIASNTTSDATAGSSDKELTLMGLDSGSPNFWAGRCALAYVTDGTLTGPEISALHILLNTYLITPTGR